jgi:tetratricopeptide (TPR) repeat protein
MAGRVNTKFVIVLTVVLVVLGLGVAAAMVLKARRDPGRYIARAEKLMVEGEYKDAAAQFGRAYSYEKSNDRRVEILLARAEALERVSAESTRDAQELMKSIEACWQKAVQLVPSNVEASEHLLELHHERAEAFSQYVNYWTNLYVSADQLLKYDPGNKAARRYRGISQIRRIEALNLGEVELNAAMDDLDQALADSPGDVDVIFHQAMGKLMAAGAAERVAEADKAEKLRAEADAKIDALVENNPDSIDAILAKYRYEIREGRRQRDQARIDEAMKLLDRAEKLLLKEDYVEQTRLVAAQLMNLDNETLKLDDGTEVRRGFYRAEQLLRHAAKLHPDDAMTLVSLGTVLGRQGRFDDALSFFLEAKKDRPVALNIQGLRAVEARAAAMKEAADLYLTQRERSRESAERDELLAKAEAQIDDLEELAGENSAMTNMMRGKIALVSRDYVAAISRLEKVSAQQEGRNVEVLNLLASAYRQAGQTGAAATTLEKLINLTAGSGRVPLGSFLELAELRLRSDEIDRASRLVDQVLGFVPDNTQALILKSQIEARKAMAADPTDREAAVGAGLAVLEKAKDKNDRAIVLQMANLHQQGGQTDQAIEILGSFHAQNPEDLAVLQQLVRIEAQVGRTDSAIARVKGAIESQPDNEVLKLLLSSLEGGETVGEQVENMIEQQEDPVERQLAFYRYYRQSGQSDKAAKALAEAARLAPNNVRVLSIQFDRMLADERFDDAEALVERAKQMNDGQGIDFANGAFWEGRLLIAKGDYLAASETLDRGLKQMPSNSQAQVLLGRALMMVGDANGAERALRRALELKPDEVSAWLLLHSIHDRRQQHDEALADLEQALKFGAGANEAVFNQYLNYLGQYGDASRAIEIRQRLAEQRPDAEGNRRALIQLYLDNQKPELAKAELDQLLAAHPDSLPNRAMEAVYLASQDRYDEGRAAILNYLQELSAENKDQAGDWATYARYLRAGNQVDDALAAYRKAAGKEDASAQPYTREMADWLFVLGRFDDAGEEYKKILAGPIKDDPQGKLVVWRRYVEALLNANKQAEAERQLSALLDQHPADAQSLLIRGLMLQQKLNDASLSEAQRQKIREQAELAYDQAVAYSRNSPMPHVQRAMFRFNNPDPQIQQLVRADLARAIELDGTAIRSRELMAQWYLRRGESDSAIEELRRLIAARPNYAPARARLAELYLVQGNRMPELDALLNESQKLMPNLPAWHQYRSRMYQAQRRFAEAEAELAKAYELDSSIGRLGEYAGLLVRMNRHAKALEVLADQPAEVSQDPTLLAVKARALYGLERTDEAIAAFNKALDLAGSRIGQVNSVIAQIQPAMTPQQQLELLLPRASTDSTGTIGLMVARLKLQYGQTDEALKELKGLAGRFEPRSALETERHRLLARSYYTTNQLAEARQSYEQVLEGAPRDLMALNNLAYLLADDLNEPAAALPLAQRAVDAVGNNRAQRANVLDTLGWVQFRNGDSRAAEETLKLSIGLSSMTANHIHLAKVYMATERQTRAKQELIVARKLAEEQKDQDALKQIDALMADLSKSATNAER